MILSELLTSRILVTGGTGFIGKNLTILLRQLGALDLTSIGSADCDLTDSDDTAKLFKELRPEYCFHFAGKVGGIQANIDSPGQFFYDNLMMGVNCLHHAMLTGVKKLVSAGAGCGFPENALNPILEEYYWDGYPQKDSAPYSLAKRMLVVQAMAYAQQYNFESVVIIPGNVYGPHDNFNLRDAHVIPALVRKFVECKESIEIWGDGKATRDFVYVTDVANGALNAMMKGKSGSLYNISGGKEYTIKQVVEHLVRISGFKGTLLYDDNRPKGQSRRLFSIDKAQSQLGYEPKVDLESGLTLTFEWLKTADEDVRY